MEFDAVQLTEQEDDTPKRTRVRTVHAARTGVVALTAFVTELLLIAATNNQGVTDWVFRHARVDRGLGDDLALSSQAFRWRFMYARRALDTVASDYARDGVVLLLSAVLIIAVVRGSVTFGRAFFGTWMAVLVATVIGAGVGSVLKNRDYFPNASAADRLFSTSTSITAFDVAAGLGLGLVVAAITAGVAVGTRRTVGTVAPLGAFVSTEPPVEYAPYQPPLAPPPWNPPVEEPPLWAPAPTYERPRQPEWASESAETVATPRFDLPADEQHTTALPRIEESAAASASWRPVDDASATTRWPVVEDTATTTLPRHSDEAADDRVEVDEDDTQLVRIEEEDLTTR